MRLLGSSVVFSSVYFNVLTVFVYKNLLIFAASVMKIAYCNQRSYCLYMSVEFEEDF